VKHLFGGALDVNGYLELCRFFCDDWCPKNTPSRFLATTHRIVKRYAPWVKVLYTYAAGFGGMHGGIYQASGYDYIGKTKCDAFLLIPGVGAVHRISLYDRYHRGTTAAKDWQDVFPGSKQWIGWNFRYIYWLCGKREKRELMDHATFDVIPAAPTLDDCEIYLKDHEGNMERITTEHARNIPLVTLKSTRPGGVNA
jgi:hypothetical protein